MRIFAIATALLFGLLQSMTVASADAGFVVDMEKDDILRLDGRRYISDLPVGEEGELTFLRACVRNGVLLLSQRSELNEGRSFNIRVMARRVTQDDVTLEFHPSDDTSPRDLQRKIAGFPARDCEEFSRLYDFGPSYRILSVNGTNRLSDLINTPPFAGALMSR